MPEQFRLNPRAWWPRPRVSIGALMLLIALIGFFLAWVVHRSRRVATIDIMAPDLIRIGDESHTPDSLEKVLSGSSAKEAVLRVETSVPFANLLRVVKAVEAAGIHDIHFEPRGHLVRPVQARPRPAAAESVVPGS